MTMGSDIFEELNRDVIGDTADGDKAVHIFITMRAAEDTSVFDWQHNVEELRAAIAAAVGVRNWRSLGVYGPDNDTFSLPGVCIEAKVTPKEYGDILRVVRQSLWIKLDVNIHKVA